MDERMRFVARIKDGERMTDLCQEFGISRKTGYKFLKRFEQYSAVGLYDMRRVAERIPHRTPAEVVELFVELRKKYPTWGAQKLRDYLSPRHPDIRLPATSTVGELLRKRGLLQPRKRRYRPAVSYSPLCHAEAPNDVWCVDFKGQFRLGNRRYCYPLTVTDALSRYILVCEGLESTRSDGAKCVFEQAFREYGLPKAIRSDNGTPFASTGLAGLSRLSVWWLGLGIKLERIEPASPQQNGRHERMHRTLKAETTRPAASTLLQQQERFDRFLEYFNKERPHEALGGRTPSEHYVPSSTPFLEHSSEPTYPLHDLVLRVTSGGHIHIPGTGRMGGSFFLSESLTGKQVGLREVDEDLWLVSFLHLDLGHIDLKNHRFRPSNPTPTPAGQQHSSATIIPNDNPEEPDPRAQLS